MNPSSFEHIVKYNIFMKSSNFHCILLLKSKERTKGYGYDFENNRPLQKFQRADGRK